MLTESIHENWERLTESERRVAYTILSNYPSSALDTLSNIASRSDVSPATVTRFISKIGLPGYPAFRERLRHEIQAHLQSPVDKAEARRPPEAEHDSTSLLPRLFDHVVTNIQASLNWVQPTDFREAVRLLANLRSRIYVTGGRLSGSVGAYLVNLLHSLRPGVTFLEASSALSFERMVDAEARDVLVALDFRRYQQSTFQLSSQARSIGMKVILVTDEWMSPIADYTSVTFPLRTQMPALWDALSVPMTFCEALVEAVAQELGPKAHVRLKRMETYAGAWVKDAPNSSLPRKP